MKRIACYPTHALHQHSRFSTDKRGQKIRRIQFYYNISEQHAELVLERWQSWENV
jgi:hypothetical protein